MPKKEEEQSMNPWILCRKGKNTHRRRYKDKRLSRVWGKDHPETTPPKNASYIQLQNPGTIVGAHKCWLTRARYSYHLSLKILKFTHSQSLNLVQRTSEVSILENIHKNMSFKVLILINLVQFINLHTRCLSLFSVIALKNYRLIIG